MKKHVTAHYTFEVIIKVILLARDGRADLTLVSVIFVLDDVMF